MAKQSPFASFAAISPAQTLRQHKEECLLGEMRCAFAYRIIAKVVTLVIQQQDVCVICLTLSSLNQQCDERRVLSKCAWGDLADTSYAIGCLRCSHY
jgi:hypothetical protein